MIDVSKDNRIGVTILQVTLRALPPSISQSVLSDEDFTQRVGLMTNATIKIADYDCAFDRSELFDAFRKILLRPAAPVKIADLNGRSWDVTPGQDEGHTEILLRSGETQLLFSEAWPFSPVTADRLMEFDARCRAICFPNSDWALWRTTLQNAPLRDAQVSHLIEDLHDTPVHIASMIGIEARSNKLNISTLVPLSLRYFERLVGRYRGSTDIVAYSTNEAAEHFAQLMTCDPTDGLAYALYLSSHPSLSRSIDCARFDPEAVLDAWQRIAKEGDYISRVGAVEAGLQLISTYPDISPVLVTLAESVRMATDEELGLLGGLVMLVEGELARAKTLAGTPPFWRRLASIAQASLIYQELVRAGFDYSAFTEWCVTARGQLFYLQSLTDLRQEPRWLPEHLSSSQLRMELVGRMARAATEFAEAITTEQAQHEFLDDGNGSIQRIGRRAEAFLPGPLEGGIDSPEELPIELRNEFSKAMDSEELDPSWLTLLVNFGLIFRISAADVHRVTERMRSAKHQILGNADSDFIYNVLMGLASIAASTRSVALSNEVLLLTRKKYASMPRELAVDGPFRIGLVAAAAHLDFEEWCQFVGRWMDEVVSHIDDSDDASRLTSNLLWLCAFTPALWQTCGRAYAALRSVAGS